MGVNIHDLGLGSGFLDTIPEVQAAEQVLKLWCCDTIKKVKKTTYGVE